MNKLGKKATVKMYQQWLGFVLKIYRTDLKQRLAIFILKRIGLIDKPQDLVEKHRAGIERIYPVICGECYTTVFYEHEKTVLNIQPVTKDGNCPICGSCLVGTDKASLLDSFYLVRSFDNTHFTPWNEFKITGEMKMSCGSSGLCYAFEEDNAIVIGFGSEYYYK